jgi:hypothetical protein
MPRFFIRSYRTPDGTPVIAGSPDKFRNRWIIRNDLKQAMGRSKFRPLRSQRVIKRDDGTVHYIVRVTKKGHPLEGRMLMSDNAGEARLVNPPLEAQFNRLYELA